MLVNIQYVHVCASGNRSVRGHQFFFVFFCVCVVFFLFTEVACYFDFQATVMRVSKPLINSHLLVILVWRTPTFHLSFNKSKYKMI